MAEFIGKKIRLEYVQEVGWLRPRRLLIGRSEKRAVREVIERWEEHTLKDPWWQRKHRVHYVVRLDDGERYELYWNRGASARGDEWILLKRLSDDEGRDVRRRVPRHS